ncbi:MAG: hypothetical protein EPO21_20315 [Chloroflexota bacterium]|nr:MAG: hypothetical protein EPO21_20315 [Chloroflexota bacterium]
MSRSALNFVRAGLIYFLLGGTLGTAMFVRGDWIVPLRPVHTHFLLLGWVSMLIFGVGYHILPRFRGRPLHSEKIADAQFWLANLGLLGMAVLWPLSYGGQTWAVSGLTLFGVIELVSLYLFAYNMLRTLG